MRQKKLIRMLLVTAALLSGAAGCTSGNTGSLETDQVKSEEGREENMEMTKEELELLKRISVDEASVEEGELVSWQREILEQVRYGLSYLNKKYPEHTFTIIDGEPKNKVNAYSVYRFNADGKEESYYNLHMDEGEEEGEYQAKDDFYSVILGEAYEKKMLKYLKEISKECAAVNVKFPYVKGEEYGADMDADTAWDNSYDLCPGVAVFIDGTSMSENNAREAADKIKAKVQKDKNGGTYTVYIMSELPQDPNSAQACLALISEKGKNAYLLKKAFQEFGE